MKKSSLIITSLFISIICLFGQTAIFNLDESKAFNLGQLLEDKNVIIIHPIGVDYEDDCLFVLDLRLSHVLKVNIRTGALLKLISSRGQGPAELGLPTSIRVKRQLLYICDRAYGGVKIFDTNSGILIKAIKINASMDDLDVLNSGHIILKKVDVSTASLISEFDDAGNWIRDIVHADFASAQRDGEKYVKETFVRFCLDTKEHIILLYPLKRIIAKYDKSGQLLWERRIENEVLKRSVTNEDSITISETGAIGYTINIFDLAIDKNDNIVVGHNGGGQIFSADGNTVALLQGKNLSTFLVFGNKMVSILPQGFAQIYDLNSLGRY